MDQGGNTTRLSPDGFQTAIDAFVAEEYERDELPNVLSSRNDMFFKQRSTDSMAVIWDEWSNVGTYQLTDEQEEVNVTSVRLANQTVKRVSKYTKRIPISWEAFKTDRHGLREQIGRNVGDRARLTQDQRAILDSYGDAFAGSVNVTPDGQALASNSHTTVNGDTVDNLETGALAPDALWTCTVSLGGQKAQDGELGGYNFSGILVPLTLYKTAKEILNSSLLANSGENNLNIFDTDYGQVAIKQSPFLGSAYNSASNANTSYHLISRQHTVSRMVLAGVETEMVEPKYSKNDTWVLVSRYAETVFPESWAGYVGSNGTA